MDPPPEKSLAIRPLNGPIHLTIQTPGSKSITNRALLCASLAHGTSLLDGVLDSEDTRVMSDCLTELGVTLNGQGPHRLQVDGVNGPFPVRTASLQVRNSGTTIRFLTAVLGLQGGQYRLDGTARMRQRPIGPLIEALKQVGATAEAESAGSCPPVNIRGTAASGGTASISGSLSSQYLSGLLMAAPLANRGLQVELTGPLVSVPYVEMTRDVMQQFGVTAKLELDRDPVRLTVDAGQHYAGCEFQIEPDATAASYFWGAAAICGGSATVTGLNRDSLQGDWHFVECLERMGCDVVYEPDRITVSGRAKQGIDVDMSDISDTVQTLAAVALFVSGPTRIRGVAHNRIKETDRIGNLAIELRKFGVQINEHDDGLTIIPGELQGAVIETYDDHRMAMALSLVGLRQPGVVITNPECTVKTYPGFFEDLNRLYD